MAEPNVSRRICLSTGVVAPPNITNDLLRAYEIGELQYQCFKENRLEKDEPINKFHDKITKLNLKTFTDANIKKVHAKKPHDVVLKADRKIFGQTIIVAESRNPQIIDVLAHPLGPLP